MKTALYENTESTMTGKTYEEHNFCFYAVEY